MVERRADNGQGSTAMELCRQLSENEAKAVERHAELCRKLSEYEARAVEREKKAVERENKASKHRGHCCTDPQKG